MAIGKESVYDELQLGTQQQSDVTLMPKYAVPESVTTELVLEEVSPLTEHLGGVKQAFISK